jgi:hypothetical protein
MSYFKNKEDVVRFVDDLLNTFTDGSPLTMTIKPSASEGFSVSIVTELSLDDLEAQRGAFFSLTQVNT